MVNITVSTVISQLKSGITRLKGDPGYSPERGSIEEIYGLSKAQVKTLFRYPKLANIRVAVPKTPEFNIIDDLEPSTTDQVEEEGVSQLIQQAEVTEYANPVEISVAPIEYTATAATIGISASDILRANTPISITLDSTDIPSDNRPF